jgi:hypothetical protein
MQFNISPQHTIALQNTNTWASFDKFKLEGAKALEQINAGHIATLITKTGQYKILSETDFQNLLGLASEVRRIKDGLNAIIATASIAQKHRDPESLEALMQVVIAIGDLPRLPSNNQPTLAQMPITETPDEDDTAILEPAALLAAQQALEASL